MRPNITFWVALTAFLLGAFARAEDSTPFDTTEVRMEFSKLSVYEGEQVTCNFYLQSPLEIIEVEVAKFPEFRGFLKDNLILRQGILATSGGNRLGGKGQAVIGSYSLIPIVGAESYSIEPMKLVIKSPGLRRVEGSIAPKITFSSGPEVRVLPLPPFPTAKFSLPFSGLVGQLTNINSDPVVPFRVNEPTVLRTTVQGVANFAEVSELPTAFPANLEVLSRSSHQQMNGSFGVKTFEVSLLPKQDQNFELPPQSLVYFDPELKTYRTLEGRESIQFQREQTVAAEVTPLARPEIVLGESASVPFFSLAVPRNLIWVNATVLFSALLMGVSSRIQRRVRQHRRHSLKPHRERFKTLEGLKNHRGFLREAETFLIEDLALKTRTEPDGKTRKKFLERVGSKMTPEQRERIGWLLAECDRGRFAPPAQRTVDTGKILEELSRIARAK